MARALTHERFDWPGQGLAIDLADTVVVVRDGETVDHLSSTEDLGRWLELEHEWLGSIGPHDGPSLNQMTRLREAVRLLLRAAALNEALPSAAVDALNRFSAMARWYRRLDVSDPVTPRMAYASETEAQGERVLAAIADSAIEILAGPDRARLRICKAPSCGMFFLEGRAGQQWCTVSCGNRARVARHYKRSKPALDGDGLSSAR